MTWNACCYQCRYYVHIANWIIYPDFQWIWPDWAHTVILVHNWGRAWVNPTFIRSAEICLTMCQHMGMRDKKKHMVELLRMLNITLLEWQSCIVLLCMLNITPQTWIEEEEELGKEVSSVHVGLNMTEQARQRRQWQGPGARLSERFNKESSRRERTACM